MRIVGLGVDLAEIERVGRGLARYQRFAARFAGKEAVMKSMGTGWRQIRWTDIEITGGGKPTVKVTGTAARRAAALGITGFEVTIALTEKDVLVFAIALGDHE